MMGNERDPLYYFNVRNDLIRLIPPQAKRILEVGCAGGMTGKALREKRFEEIVGIEVNEELAQQGKAYYDRLVIGDVEKVSLPFEKDHFDCILYGDVLEHLINPWRLLKEHNALLKNGGAVICSIPNVRHYKVIKKLVFKGKWEYTEDGIMDRMHIRFFTLDSILKMLNEAGFEIKDVSHHSRGVYWLKWLNQLLRNRLIHFLVVQYIVVAIKRKGMEGCPLST